MVCLCAWIVAHCDFLWWWLFWLRLILVVTCFGWDLLWLRLAFLTVGKHTLYVLRTFVRGDVRTHNQLKQISPFSGYLVSQVNEWDEMCHVSCLSVHWRLYLTIVKEGWKDRLPKVTTKNIFSFVDLNERPNLILSITWIKSDGHFYSSKLVVVLNHHASCTWDYVVLSCTRASALIFLYLYLCY